MIHHSTLSNQEIRSLIKQQQISFAGNQVLKIYGRLHCRSGKRMKRPNRVFFHSAEEAIANGFRPCAHCMHGEFLQWKQEKQF